MDYPNLRKIIVQLTDVDFEEGYFHTWGYDNLIGSCAIYEKEDGTIATTCPQSIKFLN